MSIGDQSSVFCVAIIGMYRMGVASVEHRTANALESLGHIVYEFSPAHQPWLFTWDRATRFVSTSKLKNFIATEKIDILLVADGCELRGNRADLGLCVVACLTTHPQIASQIPSDDSLLDNTLPIGSTVDREFAHTRIENTIALQKGLLCVQDATPLRIDRLRALRQQCSLPIRCIGAAWPEDLNYPVSEDPFDTSFVSALFASSARLRFTAGQQADRFVEALIASADRVATIDLAGVTTYDTASDAARITEAVEHTPLSSAMTLATSPSESSSKSSSESANDLEHVVSGWLIRISATHELQTRGTATQQSSTHQPPTRQMVTAFAYVGVGNFGDEYIVHTITKRLLSRPATGIIVLSENPEHTFLHRGVYATTLEDSTLVDAALARSGTALVLAGLLFDQGTRYTMGRPAILNLLRHSDLPGIDGFVALARLNNVRTIFYGIGAGPLNSPDSQAFVRHMGEQNALFLTRDKESSHAIRACGVPEDQIETKADIAFLGKPEKTRFVDNWLADHADPHADLLAVSLRDYENVTGGFEKRLATALNDFCTAHPTFMPIFCALDPADQSISQRVMSAMKHGDRARLFFAGDDLTALEDLFSRCFAGICLRLHCSLVLMREGIPCAGVSYLPKVTGLYHTLGMGTNSQTGSLLLTPDASEDQLATALATLFDHHADVHAALVTTVAQAVRSASEAESKMLTELATGMQGKTAAIPTVFRDRWRPEGAPTPGEAPVSMPPAVVPSTQLPKASKVSTTPKVSVIIPVYNTGKYLQQCIESVLTQTYRNIEVICVDDGSTDSSLELLHSYAENDDRVRVISETNSGPAVARNKGIESASGEYLTFLDSDDWMESTCVETTVRRLERTHADMAVIDYFEFNAATGVRKRAIGGILPDKFPAGTAETPGTFTWRDNPEWAFRALQNVPWNKMLRTQFVRRNHLHFEEDVRLTEDVMFSCPAIVLAHAITFVTEPLVTYRIRTDTDTMAHKDSHPLDFLTAFITLRGWLQQQGVWANLRVAFRNWSLNSCHYNLTTVRTWEGYDSVYTALQQHGLSDLDLQNVDPKAIQEPYLQEFLADLTSLSAPQFLYAEFARRRDANDDAHSAMIGMKQQSKQAAANAKRREDELNRRIDELHHRLAEASQRETAVRRSRSYRIGNALMRPLAAVRDIVHRLRRH